ncbi:TPA: hypothetical protein VJE30_001324 [Streptococcus pyogenes]|nr:hypothetical protein [Streptococcus pyogenes]
MIDIIYALFHSVYIFCLLFSWFFPIFRVRLRKRTGEDIRELKASAVLMMLLTIFWPKSEIKLVKKGK